MRVKYNIVQMVSFILFLLAILGNSAEMFFISILMFIIGELSYQLFIKNNKKS